MKTKNKNGRLLCPKNVNLVVLVLALVVNAFFVSGCAEKQIATLSVIGSNDTADVIMDHYWESERVLVAAATVEKDTSVASACSVSFNQVASLRSNAGGPQFDYSFTPTLYLNVELQKPQIEVSSVDSIPVTLVHHKIVSRIPFAEGTTLGEDVVEEFTYSDGQVAVISYGHRYAGVVSYGDTLATPHLEIASVSYSDFSSQQTKEDTYKVTMDFVAKWVSRGASVVQSDSIVLNSWYVKSVVEKDIVGTPIWNKEILWNGSESVTLKVTKTTPHSLLDDEVEIWQHDLDIVLGKMIDNSWYVADNSVFYENSTSLLVVSTSDKGPFHITTMGKQYNFSPYYMMPGGHYLLPTPDFMLMVFSYFVTFDLNDENQHFEFKVDVDLVFSQSVQYLEERAALYPNDTYLGSDVKEFSYINAETGKEILHHTAYTDLKLHP